MSKILEMRQKRAEVWDKARAFLDERTNESGVMSAEDSQQYERMEQEVVDLGHTIDRMERAEQMDREMNERVSPNLASRPIRRSRLLLAGGSRGPLFAAPGRAVCSAGSGWLQDHPARGRPSAAARIREVPADEGRVRKRGAAS